MIPVLTITIGDMIALAIVGLCFTAVAVLVICAGFSALWDRLCGWIHGASGRRKEPKPD